jgi:hypothetical protein
VSIGTSWASGSWASTSWLTGSWVDIGVTAVGDTFILNVGASQIVIVCQKAGENPPFRVGGKSRAYAGNERSSIRAEKAVVSLVTTYLPTATKRAIKALCANGAQLTCSGEILDNVPTLCSIDVTSTMVPGDPGRWEMSLTVTAV